MDEMDQIVQEFLVESYENLDQLDQDLIALESDPGSRDLLSSIFRTVHTIKGTSGFLGMGNLEHLAHAGENLLAELRDGSRTMDRRIADVLLLLVDRLREMLASIEAGNGDSIDSDDAIQAIAGIQAAPPGDDGDGGATGPEDAARSVEESQPHGEGSQPHVSEDPTLASPAASGTDLVPTPELVVVEEAPLVPTPEHVPGSGAPQAGTAPTRRAEESKPEGESHHLRSAVDSSVRVDVDLLDSLMRQVGELVLVRNQIDRMVDGTTDAELLRATQRLNLISADLQRG